MVNDAQSFGIDPSGGHPERALALSYAPIHTRPAAAALFALDATLGGIVRAAREPVVAQMRLAWWDEALRGLDSGAVPAHPVLTSLTGGSMDGVALAAMIDGWELLLNDEMSVDALRRFGHARGGRLFAALAGLVGQAGDAVVRAGEGWALADLAIRMSDPAVADRAAALAREVFAEQARYRWPGPLRFLGAFARSASFDLANPATAGSPGRVARLLRLRIVGR